MMITPNRAPIFSCRWFPLSYLDRGIFRGFLAGYVGCLISFLCLYVVIDAFTKLDEFAERATGLSQLVVNVGSYYLYRLPWFFDRLSGVLSLIAVVFTLAWMERQNEIVAWLAAGVSVRRLMLPLLAASGLVIGLAVANREIVIPRCAQHLQYAADDPKGTGLRMVHGGYDKNGIHIDGCFADPQRQVISQGRIIIPSNLVGGLVQLTCAEMHYRPPKGKSDNGWWLTGVEPANWASAAAPLDWYGPGTYFLHTDMTFERLTRDPMWFRYESTRDLLHAFLSEINFQRRSECLVLIHQRLTAPLVDGLLILAGLGLMRVGRADRNLFLRIGACLIVYAVLFGLEYTCATLAHQEYLDPVLAAWVPVLAFGPFTIVVFAEPAG